MSPANHSENDNQLESGVDQFSGVDAQLLARNEAKEKEAEKKETTAEQSISFREAMMRARRKRLVARLKAKRKAQKTAKPNLINKETSALLRQAWLNIIDSFGLTLIWINIHVFLGILFGNKLFCKLGQEWAGMGGNLFNKLGKKGKASTKERILFGILDSCGCLTVIIILAIVAMMLGVITSPLKALSELLGNIWKALSS